VFICDVTIINQHLADLMPQGSSIGANVLASREAIVDSTVHWAVGYWSGGSKPRAQLAAGGGPNPRHVVHDDTKVRKPAAPTGALTAIRARAQRLIDDTAKCLGGGQVEQQASVAWTANRRARHSRLGDARH